MRTRAYRPEVPGCLEDRSLLSGVAGLSADPVVLSHRRFNKFAELTRLGFHSFGRDRDVSALRSEIYDVAVMIPFGRVDGLGVSVNRILDEDAARSLRQRPSRDPLGPRRGDRRDPCGGGGPGPGRRRDRALIAAE